MKNCYKRMLIMFVMVLGIMSVYTINAFASDDFEIGTSNLNNTVENSAELGDILKLPEIGWKRYDDTDNRIQYDTSWVVSSPSTMNYNNTEHNSSVLNSKMSFEFWGTKFRLINRIHPNRSNRVQVKIDGVVSVNNNQYSITDTANTITFEATELGLGVHTVEIENLASGYMVFDALDIDNTGYLINPNESVLLDKSSLNLKENNTKRLTATTTPSAVDVEWSSSDETTAKVDKNGKVTGIKEGTCIVTAQIKGTDVKATCEVTVTKEDIVEPEEPSIENGSLYIEMIDGNIKRADKSQIEKFRKWFISRDLDETESPIFKITNAKGNIEYLVHDKVVGFEIRE